MERFSDMLSVGGKTNSLGRANDVLQIVLDDQTRLDELFACMFHDDAWVRMRAIDSFEKICRVHPLWIEPYVEKLLRDLADCTQPSILWHLAEIFIQVRLTDDQQTRVTAWLRQLLSTVQVDWIVSANAMKAVTYFMNKGAMTRDEVRELLQIQQGHHSKSVRKKATQVLELLDN